MRYAEGAGLSTAKVCGYSHVDFLLALTSITDGHNKLFACSLSAGERSADIMMFDRKRQDEWARTHVETP